MDREGRGNGNGENQSTSHKALLYRNLGYTALVTAAFKIRVQEGVEDFYGEFRLDETRGKSS